MATIRMSLKKTYITVGGHIVTPIEKCACGDYECQVRKNGKNVRPRSALWIMDSDKVVKGTGTFEPLAKSCVHYHPNGRLDTGGTDSSRKPSPFDVIAVWED
jgi:hypothetical protein